MTYSVEAVLIASLPPGWHHRRLKEVSDVIPSNVDKLSVDGQPAVRLCNYVDTYKNEKITSAIDFMSATATHAQIERLSLKKGDITITKDSESPWDIAVPAFISDDIEGLVCGYHLSRIEPKAGAMDGRYLSWALRSKPVNLQFALAAQGITRYGLSSSALADGVVPCPPHNEQLAIAFYLDVETARIDGLINEKQRLVRLLNEQKRMVGESVIAPAPEGREAKLGFFVDLLPGYAFSSEGFTHVQTDLPLLRGVNVAPSAIRWEDVVYWPSDQTSGLDRFRLEAGDVVFGMDRPWISSGTRVAMIDEASAGALLLQRVCRIRGDETMSNRFIYHALSSDKFRQSIEFELSGISVPHISPEQITRFRVPLLSIAEQHSRCISADAELAEIDRLILVTGEMILALQELRSATITDAVFGRIDVRDHTKN